MMSNLLMLVTKNGLWTSVEFKDQKIIINSSRIENDNLLTLL